jgi:hypothetical protein
MSDAAAIPGGANTGDSLQVEDAGSGCPIHLRSGGYSTREIFLKIADACMGVLVNFLK